jgi:hypothetical protein
MVAINATIEAVRSGAEGSTFKVVSDELRELAEGINGFAHNLGAEINTIRQGMTESHKIMMRLANKDMIPQMILQEKTERITIPLSVDQATALTLDAPRNFALAAPDTRLRSFRIVNIDFQ